jgi:hypothetical protein
MLRLAVISWLILTTLFGPALCCCSLQAMTSPMTSHPAAPPEESRPCCCALEREKPDEGPNRNDTPMPHSCACKQVGKVAVAPTAGWSSDLTALQRLASELLSWPAIDFSSPCHDPVVTAGLLDTPGILSTPARLHVLQTLRC